jgi:hypothetical protein
VREIHFKDKMTHGKLKKKKKEKKPEKTNEREDNDPLIRHIHNYYVYFLILLSISKILFTPVNLGSNSIYLF